MDKILLLVRSLSLIAILNLNMSDSDFAFLKSILTQVDRRDHWWHYDQLRLTMLLVKCSPVSYVNKKLIM